MYGEGGEHYYLILFLTKCKREECSSYTFLQQQQQQK